MPALVSCRIPKKPNEWLVFIVASLLSLAAIVVPIVFTRDEGGNPAPQQPGPPSGVLFELRLAVEDFYGQEGWVLTSKGDWRDEASWYVLVVPPEDGEEEGGVAFTQQWQLKSNGLGRFEVVDNSGRALSAKAFYESDERDGESDYVFAHEVGESAPWEIEKFSQGEDTYLIWYNSINGRRMGLSAHRFYEEDHSSDGISTKIMVHERDHSVWSIRQIA